MNFLAEAGFQNRLPQRERHTSGSRSRTSLLLPTVFVRLASLAILCLWSSASAVAPLAAQKISSPTAPTEHSPAPTAPSHLRITGSVINSVTGAPVPRAELSVSHMSARRASQRQQEQPITVTADAAGRFQMELPSAGGWSLAASAHGYETQAHDSHEGFSTAIILTDAAPAFDLTFRLPQAAAIEGFVLDEAGEPVRNAQVTVTFVPPAEPDDAHPRHQVRGTQRTDDRGHYKVPGLLSGEYQIRLEARPWYATAARRFGGFSGITSIAGSVSSDGSGAGHSSGSDPLDVVYPLVWYPGVTDYAAATSLSLNPGESREADFRLSPLPGFHLQIPAINVTSADPRRPANRGGTYLTQLVPDGLQAGLSMASETDTQGNTDFSGLAPGSYVIHRPGNPTDAASSTAVIQISSNSPRSLDLSQAAMSTPVSVKIDPAADLPSLQISFRGLDTNDVTFAQSPENLAASARGHRRGTSTPNVPVLPPSNPSASAAPDRPAERIANLQPGRYSVTLTGVGDLHLASIEATGATATGRIVTIAGGAPSLILHTAAGRADVAGVVELRGKPDPGALVMLVPTTLGDESGLNVVRRDQSNSDGSFDILDVLPGAYILVAIDRGWEINWRDPSALRRFLMHGLPVDLTVPQDRRETVEAQSP